MKPLILAGWIAMVGGQSLDTASTLWFLHGSVCTEGNVSIYGDRPTTARLVTIKALTVGGTAGAVILLNHLHWKPATITAHALNYVSGITGATSGIQNLKGCRK